MGLQFADSFAFTLENGRAEAFLHLPDSLKQAELLRNGRKILEAKLQEHSMTSPGRRGDAGADWPGTLLHAGL